MGLHHRPAAVLVEYLAHLWHSFYAQQPPFGAASSQETQYTYKCNVLYGSTPEL